MERKKHLTIILACIAIFLNASMAICQVNHDYKKNTTFEYKELIEAYEALLKLNSFWNVAFDSIGPTDSGKPLHCLTIFSKKFNSIESAKANGCVTIFINNGIHPGESCGIEASYLFAKDLLSNANSASNNKQNIIYCIVPIFNVGGMLNRNCCTRSNQNGPEEHGFRGSSRNLDLNRDFIKCDATETQSLIAFLRKTDPDIFIDTHTSDGADYSYTMTLIETQQNKLLAPLQKFQQAVLTPALYKGMQAKGNEMAPYVDFKEQSLKSGLVDFLDIPRFSTGYTSLFHCFGYVTEAHMLKSFPERVDATLDFLVVLNNVATSQATEILKARFAAKTLCKSELSFPIQWKLDTTQHTNFTFKGFEEEAVFYPEFELNTIAYNRNKPIEISIPYYKSYSATTTIEKPQFYIIPQQWKKAIHLLELNKISLTPILNDTIIEVETYRIAPNFKNRNGYEGHYLHSGISVQKQLENVAFHAGDFMIKTGTENDYFLVSVLEPEAIDSYFAWNFFDEILMQKEYYSDYLILPQFAEKINTDTAFNSIYNALKAKGLSGDDLVYELYRSTEAYEKTHLRYPVYRVR